MSVLIACEFSGIVRQAFIELGYDAISCDFLDTEIPGPHYKGDVRDIINNGWSLMIAHPPCTRLCNSGVRWLHERNLWTELKESANFFKLLLNAPIERICIENPIPHKYALDLIGVKYSQRIQPYEHGHPDEHGHPECKSTCLWLKNLPPLEITNLVEGRGKRVHKEPPSPNRWKNRSRTYPGIAKAMATQWASLL